MKLDNGEKKYLEKFILDIDCLDNIENSINSFNVFETLGIVKTEIRHSNMLAWLLNPNENHGIGDVFIKKFIQYVIYNNMSKCQLNLFDIYSMDYYDFVIRREWSNIDLLIYSEKNKFVICIENKVFSKESNNQLKKYFNIVNKEFENFKKIFLFLTPEGDLPSDEENWGILSYNEILKLLEGTLKLKADNMNKDIKNFINQYMDILRRYIVDDENLRKICNDIYYKHQKALDLIYEYKTDRYSQVSELIKKALSKHDVIEDRITKNYNNFTTKDIDKVLPKIGDGWTKSKRILLFEILNKDNKVALELIIGPSTDDNIRNKIFNIAIKNPNIFKNSRKKLSAKWTKIYSRNILEKNYFEKYDIDEIEEKIDIAIDNFFKLEVDEINDCIVKSLS